MYDNGWPALLVTTRKPDCQAQLAAAYQNEVLHKGIDLNTLLLNGIDDYLPFDFIKEAEQLRLMPLYELMEKLFNLFQMSCIRTTGCLSVRLL